MSNAASALRAFPTVCPNYLRADLVRTLSCSSRVIAARALYMKAWGNPKNILQSGSIISSEYLYLPLDSVRAQTTVPLVRLRPRSGGGSAPARIQQHFAYLQTQNPKNLRGGCRVSWQARICAVNAIFSHKARGEASGRSCSSDSGNALIVQENGEGLRPLVFALFCFWCPLRT